MITGSIDLSENRYIFVNQNEKVEMDNKAKKISFIKDNKVNWVKYFEDFEGIEGICFIEYCLTKNLEKLLFSDNAGYNIYSLSLLEGTIDIAVKLNREEKDDADFYRNSFIEINTGCIFVYEGGLVNFTTDGKVVWHVKHQYYDWMFAGIKNGCAVYENEFDGKWGYRLEDGQKVDFK